VEHNLNVGTGILKDPTGVSCIC